MDTLQKAIEDITYISEKFPEEAFRIISDNKDEAIPYLRAAVKYACSKGGELSTDYELHLYALFLLAQFQDREFFPEIIEFVSLPDDDLDYMIGDCITEGLADILYNTYNGDAELLKSAILNDGIGEFTRSSMLKTLTQLYLDRSVSEDEFKAVLKRIVYDVKDGGFLYCAAAEKMCTCHFIDMLPDIRCLFDNDLLDEHYMGMYDSYVDAMFDYNNNRTESCKSPINAADSLRGWAMFKNASESGKKNIKNSELLDAVKHESVSSAAKAKIGRNDPCPCGSGKKYKNCCLNKPRAAIDNIESVTERSRWLKKYPCTGGERVEGRIYLEDYFDKQSIEIDKILYLALMHRPQNIFVRNERTEEARSREYLWLAFLMCSKRIENEQIPSFAEYDAKYSIHYKCGEWTGRLLELLKSSYDTERYRELEQWCLKMK